MQNIPLDILITVAQFLETADLIGASHVSRGWRGVIVSSPHLWQAPTFELDFVDRPSIFSEYVTLLCRPDPALIKSRLQGRSVIRLALVRTGIRGGVVLTDLSSDLLRRWSELCMQPLPTSISPLSVDVFLHGFALSESQSIIASVTAKRRIGKVTLQQPHAFTPNDVKTLADRERLDIDELELYDAQRSASWRVSAPHGSNRGEIDHQLQMQGLSISWSRSLTALTELVLPRLKWCRVEEGQWYLNARDIPEMLDYLSFEDITQFQYRRDPRPGPAIPLDLPYSSNIRGRISHLRLSYHPDAGHQILTPTLSAFFEDTVGHHLKTFYLALPTTLSAIMRIKLDNAWAHAMPQAVNLQDVTLVNYTPGSFHCIGRSLFVQLA